MSLIKGQRYTWSEIVDETGADGDVVFARGGLPRLQYSGSWRRWTS